MLPVSRQKVKVGISLLYSIFLCSDGSSMLCLTQYFQQNEAVTQFIFGLVQVTDQQVQTDQLSIVYDGALSYTPRSKDVLQ